MYTSVPGIFDLKSSCEYGKSVNILFIILLNDANAMF